MNETSTLISDFVMGTIALILGTRLWKNRCSNLASLFWVLAFWDTAVTAYLGGIFHGFRETMASPTANTLWKCTLVSVPPLSALMSLAILFLVTQREPLRWAGSVLIGTKAVFFMVLLWTRPLFLYAVWDYGSAMAFIALICAWKVAREKTTWASPILWGIGVSLVAATFQRFPFRTWGGLNHNDLYHLIQVGALLLFFRAGRNFTTQ